MRLVDVRNVYVLLTELKEYAQEIDVEFAKKAIEAIGRIAVKLEDTAERCVLAFQELIKQRLASQFVIE